MLCCSAKYHNFRRPLRKLTGSATHSSLSCLWHSLNLYQKNKAVIWLNQKKECDLDIFASNIILIISKTNNLEGAPKQKPIQTWHQNKMIQTLPSCSLNQPIKPQIMKAIPLWSSHHCVWVVRIHNMTIMVMVNRHYWFSFSSEYWSHVKQTSFFLRTHEKSTLRKY